MLCSRFLVDGKENLPRIGLRDVNLARTAWLWHSAS
eukprot:COSAG05_NODE_23070_length_260_cov_0.956522_1_plen_35_part_10